VSAILTAALAYAARGGLAVFPARPDKKCSYKSAEYSDGRKWGMTRDPAEIRADFSRWPRAGIGIPTGAINRRRRSISTAGPIAGSTAIQSPRCRRG